MEQKFSFSLTEEEKQGSFECLQQTHTQMNVMGGIQQRMRVQAQEDVYENTRRSMAQAAQNQKSKWWVEWSIRKRNIIKRREIGDFFSL